MDSYPSALPTNTSNMDISEILPQRNELEERIGVGVAFWNIDVYGSIASSRTQPTVTSYMLEIFASLIGILRTRKDTRSQLLHNFNGLICSGEVLLVLGRPGSGCSTLLKTLSGETRGLYVGDESKFSYYGEFVSVPFIQVPY
jgi:ATP-binding cassette subfamily G (WHITE) protein 2 (PDR)